jgi:molecular chaperone DnaK
VEEWSKQDANDAGYIRRRMIGIRALSAEIEGRLRSFAAVASDMSGAVRAREKTRIEAWFSQSVYQKLDLVSPARIEKEPGEVNVELSIIRDELDRIELAVDRLPSLGLVTERDSEDGAGLAND